MNFRFHDPTALWTVAIRRQANYRIWSLEVFPLDLGRIKIIKVPRNCGITELSSLDGATAPAMKSL